MAVNAQALASEFGGRVRERRLELGLSQEDLADVCGLHRTYVGSVERGKRNVSLVNIVRLAEALKIDPGRLLRGVQSRPDVNRTEVPTRRKSLGRHRGAAG